MGRQKLGLHEEAKVWCKRGKETFLITQKQDRMFYLYQVLPDGYAEIPGVGKSADPRMFDSIIWPSQKK